MSSLGGVGHDVQAHQYIVQELVQLFVTLHRLLQLAQRRGPAARRLADGRLGLGVWVWVGIWVRSGVWAIAKRWIKDRLRRSTVCKNAICPVLAFNRNL